MSNLVSALTAAVVCFLVAACSSGEGAPPTGVSSPQIVVDHAIDAGPYELENTALDRAVSRTGLPRDASIWVQRSADGKVVCGALSGPGGKPVLYLAGMVSGGYLGAPLARVTPEVSERMLNTSNRAVMTNCADRGVIPPEHVQRLLSE